MSSDLAQEAARRYRRGQKVSPFLYAVWFPVPAVLKIGCATNRSVSVYVSAARQGARSRGWDIDGSLRIWHEPGDERTEAFVQASLSFEWPGACTGRQLRLSEWFRPDLAEAAIAARLAQIYRRVPQISWRTIVDMSALQCPHNYRPVGRLNHVEPRRKRRYASKYGVRGATTWVVSQIADRDRAQWSQCQADARGSADAYSVQSLRPSARLRRSTPSATSASAHASSHSPMST